MISPAVTFWANFYTSLINSQTSRISRLSKLAYFLSRL